MLAGGDDPDEPDSPPPPPDSGDSAPQPGDRATAESSRSSLPDPVGELRFQVQIDDARDRRLRGVQRALAWSTTSSSTRREARCASCTSSAAGSSTRTSCSSGESPTRTRCSSGSSTSRPTARPRATSRSSCWATTASRCGLVVRRRVPRQVVGPVLQCEVHQRRHRDPGDLPSGPDRPDVTRRATTHGVRASQAFRSRARTRRSSARSTSRSSRSRRSTSGRSTRSSARPCRRRSSAAASRASSSSSCCSTRPTARTSTSRT